MLRAMGLRIAIDDFGTGHASLSYLRQFPIDSLKIDRAFISDLETSREGSAIINAIIGLAHGLDLDVVAEGVETEGQLRFLAERGCEEYQGFLVSEPLPSAAVPAFVDRLRSAVGVAAGVQAGTGAEAAGRSGAGAAAGGRSGAVAGAGAGAPGRPGAGARGGTGGAGGRAGAGARGGARAAT